MSLPPAALDFIVAQQRTGRRFSVNAHLCIEVIHTLKLLLEGNGTLNRSPLVVGDLGLELPNFFLERAQQSIQLGSVLLGELLALLLQQSVGDVLELP